MHAPGALQGHKSNSEDTSKIGRGTRLLANTTDLGVQPLGNTTKLNVQPEPLANMDEFDAEIASFMHNSPMQPYLGKGEGRVLDPVSILLSQTNL